jgi:hypothetical protein
MWRGDAVLHALLDDETPTLEPIGRSPNDVRVPARRIRVGAPADLVLLRQPWQVGRSDLDSIDVIATIIDGAVVYSG